MRTRTVVVLCTLLAVVLLVPTGAWARRVTVVGSLSITLASIATLTNQLAVTVLTLHRHDDELLDPAIDVTQTMPLTGNIYTVPFAVNWETGGAVAGDLDTTVTMVNLTGARQFPVITVRRLDGAIAATIPLVGGIAPSETKSIRLSEVLP